MFSTYYTAGFGQLYKFCNSPSAIRAKEMGVRKTVGALKQSIAMQFFIESAIYTVIAFVSTGILFIQ
jgi:hypothetical protein